MTSYCFYVQFTFCEYIVRRFLIQFLGDGMVHGDDLHGKTKHEDAEHDQKPGQVLHQVADDDSPRPEQVVERQEVKDLHARHQERYGEHLIAEVYDGGQVEGGD